MEDEDFRNLTACRRVMVERRGNGRETIKLLSVDMNVCEVSTKTISCAPCTAWPQSSRISVLGKIASTRRRRVFVCKANMFLPISSSRSFCAKEESYWHDGDDCFDDEDE